jgi:hypothetical protein
MNSIDVTIREKDKRSKNLSLYNLKDEVVNFLYKETVANSTKADQQFYILVYFASIKAGEKSFIESLFDTVLPKFNSLNQAFALKKDYLRRSEYAEMVAEYGLTDFFAKDIFFILAEAVLNLNDIGDKYSSTYANNEDLKQVIENLRTIYRPLLEENYDVFKATRITDYRTDDNGVTHDLSKSVYRTIQMRNARNLELNLQRYTTVKSITSKSPIVVDIIQNVDPQIIFDLWDKYHVVDYFSNVYRLIEKSPLATTVVGGVISGGIVAKYTAWKSINGNDDRKGKIQAKSQFETAKTRDSGELEALNVQLVKSVLESKDLLKKELAHSKKELREALSNKATADDKELIKRLQNRVFELENIEVHTSLRENAGSNATN